MVRITPVFVCLLLHISISKVWSYRLSPYGSFRTLCVSPTNGPFFVSVKPLLVVMPNENNTPDIRGPEENLHPHSDMSEVKAHEKDVIEEENLKMYVEESTTEKETVSVAENETRVDDMSFYNDRIEVSDFRNMTSTVYNSSSID